LTFGALARLRRDRALHPNGATQRGRAQLAPAGADLARELDVEAIVRFSRGAGLPARFPDVNGLAIRLVDARGPGLHRDLLLSSAGPGPLRRILMPAIDFGTSRFSSVLSFGLRGHRVVLTASVRGRALTLDRLRREPAQRIDVAAVPRGQEPVDLLTITTTEVIDGRPVRFRPWKTDSALVPLGLLNALRGPAYAAGQASAPPSSPGGNRRDTGAVVTRDAR
jgi:hypothetical protein